MIKIGLTGGIGSGKSTISSYLLKKGVTVIDADKISREIYNIYPNLKNEIKNSFGEEFLDEKGNLKRRELGNYVFKFKGKRKKLEHIVMPYIKKEIFIRLKSYEENGVEVCILDAPTLIENNLHKKMDVNILVYVDIKTQVSRVMKRDNLSYEDTLRRINAQLPLKKKKKKVQYIIDNSGDVKDSFLQLEEVLNDIQEKYK
ncbi:dephospho-CoA kinase [Hathewaya massiliensis]|uniref:dephospho-CoA kinase n=1 Tax=Hathewaya massiliensis TaxID=1964382 RepID=UPI001159B0FB|nr:dephospho-CoA kinase [Hathewaya massiliensis]